MAARSEPAPSADSVGPDRLERANDRIRSAAKWLIASSAAVGAALIAGSQLSSIGKLDVGLPTSVENTRLWVAASAAAVGLAGVVYAVWTAVQILLPKEVPIKELDDGWCVENRPPGPVVAYFKEHPKYLQGFDAALAENVIRAGQAACSYSWRIPPRRSRRRMSRRAICSGSAIGAGNGCSGRAFAMP
jgi:hypothetical protein